MINVLVTGTSGTNTGTQIMTALLLCPERYRLVVTDIEKLSYGSLKVESSYIVPPATSPEYFPEILTICKKEQIQVMIPGSEPELKACSEKRKFFEAAKVHLLTNNTNTISIAMDKIQTIRFLEEHGFLCPKSLIINHEMAIEQEADRILGQLRFPLVLKPYVGSGGSNHIDIAQSRDEFVSYLTVIGSRTKLKMMVQEYEGTPHEEYTVGILSNKEGESFSSFALRRLINTSFTRKIHVQNRNLSRIQSNFLTISTGVSQGWVDDFPEIRRYAENVANALGSTGPLNIQCRKTERGIVIFEINPRFSGTTSIRAVCGHNDPDILIQNRLFEKTYNQVNYSKGLVLRGLENHFVEGSKLK